jgi:hypothetical protein
MQKSDFEGLIPDPLEKFGGENLEGSGFEEETPEPGSEWRDPR